VGVVLAGLLDGGISAEEGQKARAVSIRELWIMQSSKYRSPEARTFLHFY
jgi:hypothetical protein